MKLTVLFLETSFLSLAIGEAACFVVFLWLGVCELVCFFPK